MRQALHIFKKDVRYLWIEIAMVILAAGLLVFSGMRQSPWLKTELSRNVIGQVIPFLLPIAWWTLIVRAIHAEALVGDREFWPTRPYSWRSLLAAKALLLVLFVNVPLLVAQAAIVKEHGFSWGQEVAGLLWSQVLIILAFILPVAAIAVLTAGIMQFLLVVLVGVVVSLLISMRFVALTMLIVGGGWGPLDWWQNYYSLLLVAIAAAAILFWQYATRLALPARLFAGAILLLSVLGAPFSWTTAFAMQSRLSHQHIDEASLHAGFASNFKFTARSLVNRDGSVSLHIPLELSGVPDSMMAKSEGLTFSIEAPGGATWRGDDHPWSNASTTGQLITLLDTLDGPFYQKVKDQPVRLRGYLYLTLYGNRRVSKVPFDDRMKPVPTQRSVPGLGLCVATAGGGAPYFLACDAAFRGPAELVSVSFEGGREIGGYAPRMEPSFSPFPARLTFNPIYPYVAYSTFKGPLDAATVVSIEPLAQVRAPIAIDDLRLADYEAKLK